MKRLRIKKLCRDMDEPPPPPSGMALHWGCAVRTLFVFQRRFKNRLNHATLFFPFSLSPPSGA